MSSFWGALVKPDTPHSTNTPSSLEITLATLGSTTKDCEAVLFLKLQDAPHVVKPIATLRNNSKSQTIRMNLSLEKHVSFELSVRGAPVHVSGYLEPDEDDDMSEAGDEDPFARWTGGQEGSESEDEDEDEDEESSEEEEVSGGQKRPAPDHSADAKRAKLDQQTQQAKKQAEQKAKQAKQQAEQKAKQQAEQKAKQQAEQKAKQQAEQKAKQQAEQKAKQAEQKAAAAPLKKTTLAGGLEIQDMQVGKGKFAQSGKQIVVGYFGKLTNGKKFDSSSVGEVIKGWDMGFAGMREGGKRRIKVPAALGYGKRGAPPQIPGNATLLFDIELKKVL